MEYVVFVVQILCAVGLVGLVLFVDYERRRLLVELDRLRSELISARALLRVRDAALARKEHNNRRKT